MITEFAEVVPALFGVLSLNTEIQFFFEVCLDVVDKLKEGKVERFLQYPVYEVVHEHIRLKLLPDVGLLYFDCHFLSVFEFGLVHLSK